MARTKSIQKSAPAPTALAPISTPAPADVAPALVVEGCELATIVNRIRDAVGSLGSSTTPSDARRVALAVEADLLRLGIRSVNLRAQCATLANAAHVAELAALVHEVQS